jgi:hypothetical protein
MTETISHELAFFTTFFDTEFRVLMSYIILLLLIFTTLMCLRTVVLSAGYRKALTGTEASRRLRLADLKTIGTC